MDASTAPARPVRRVRPEKKPKMLKIVSAVTREGGHQQWPGLGDQQVNCQSHRQLSWKSLREKNYAGESATRSARQCKLTWWCCKRHDGNDTQKGWSIGRAWVCIASTNTRLTSHTRHDADRKPLVQQALSNHLVACDQGRLVQSESHSAWQKHVFLPSPSLRFIRGKASCL